MEILKTLNNVTVEDLTEDGAFVIPEGIEAFCKETFRSCRNQLRKVIIPGSVKEIPKQAFINFTALENVKLEFGVEGIQKEAFSQYKKLQEISIPDSVEYIMDNAFYHCESLTSIELPVGLKTIHVCTFEYCKQLEEVYFPAFLKKIEAYAFRCCESLKGIELWNDLQYIGESAFSYCTSLQSVFVESGHLNQKCFGYCNQLKNVILCDEVTAIDSFAFLECENLMEVVLPNSEMKIAKDAFPKHTKITVEEVDVFSFESEEQVNKLQDYLEENFNLASCAPHLVGDILAFVAAQGEGAEEKLDLLCMFLDSTGIERDEIKKAIKK